MSTETLIHPIALRGPQAGDAVRAENAETRREFRTEATSIGIIQGNVGQELSPDTERSIIFNASTFRGPAYAKEGLPETVSSSGGPGTISTAMRELRPTNEMVDVYCWKWKSYPKAGGGEGYTIRVPLWEWIDSGQTTS